MIGVEALARFPSETEHAVVDDYAELMAKLARLRAQGARIGLDDAGAGFSSLRHIVRLHPASSSSTAA